MSSKPKEKEGTPRGPGRVHETTTRLKGEKKKEEKKSSTTTLGKKRGKGKVLLHLNSDSDFCYNCLPFFPKRGEEGAKIDFCPEQVKKKRGGEVFFGTKSYDASRSA